MESAFSLVRQVMERRGLMQIRYSSAAVPGFYCAFTYKWKKTIKQPCLQLSHSRNTRLSGKSQRCASPLPAIGQILREQLCMG